MPAIRGGQWKRRWPAPDRGNCRSSPLQATRFVVLTKRSIVERTLPGSAVAVSASDGIQLPITVTVAITLRRRGVEARLVVGGKPAKSDAAPDQKLVGLIIKAHKAVGMLVAGDAASVDAVSAALGMDASDVTRVIPLAFLAPDITAAILDGRCPTSLTANRLRSIGPLPADWAEQRRILEFAGP